MELPKPFAKAPEEAAKKVVSAHGPRGMCTKHTQPEQHPSNPRACLQAAPAKEAVKAASQQVAKPGKRRGPLPLWLAEILVILGISGLLYAVIRW